MLAFNKRMSNLDLLLEDVSQDAEQYFVNNDEEDVFAPTHKGGTKELWEKIKNFCFEAKSKALRAFGLGDDATIKDCIAKLAGFIGNIIRKIKDAAVKLAPSIKAFLDKIANYVMDAIDYIKSEFE